MVTDRVSTDGTLQSVKQSSCLHNSSIDRNDDSLLESHCIIAISCNSFNSFACSKIFILLKNKKRFLSSQPYLVRFTVVKVDGRSKMSGRFCSITSTMTELKTTVHFGSSTHFFNYRVFCYFYPNFSIYSSCIHFCPSLTISILTFASLLFLAILLEIFLRSLLNPQHFLRLSSGGTQATSFSQADTREPP